MDIVMTPRRTRSGRLILEGALCSGRRLCSTTSRPMMAPGRPGSAMPSISWYWRRGHVPWRATEAA